MASYGLHPFPAFTALFGLHDHVWPPRPWFALMASFRPLRPYPGLHGLVSASTARLARPHLAFKALSRPLRPYSASMATFGLRDLRLALTASTALSQPPRPRLASTTLVWPWWPCSASTASSQPQRPYPDLHGLVLASTASVSVAPFGPNGLIPALSQPSWPRSALMAPYGLHPFPGLHGLVRPPRPCLASAAPFSPNGLISASLTLSWPPRLRLASKVSFDLNGHVWLQQPRLAPTAPTALFNLVNSAHLKDYLATLSSIIGRSLTPLHCRANPTSTSL
uniref:Uncharacterized protein n=1 Tax=Fagus sylvatica TaxID=28930 RepID=A0A2N9G3W2_FAGSY